MQKVTYPVDKHAWCPSLIPGAIVLISTYDAQGQPNVAPKSWVQMAWFQPPVLMFSGSQGNTTENNILATGCFGVNLVDASLADRVYGCLRWFGRERIEQAGFSLVPATTIEAPLVADCRAHLECRLVDTHAVGSGCLIFGEIVAASIWDAILVAPPARRYALLDQIVFLEDGLYATMQEHRAGHHQAG